jgi:hypothetical protein
MVDYDRDIQPIIKSTVIKSLKCYQSTIKPHRSCFEMYGYDFLLTDDFRPMLLCNTLWDVEVNMSPACAERTEWLTDMVDQMAEGLLSLVLPKKYIDLGPFTNRWKLIFQDWSIIYSYMSIENLMKYYRKCWYHWYVHPLFCFRTVSLQINI